MKKLNPKVEYGFDVENILDETFINLDIKVETKSEKSSIIVVSKKSKEKDSSTKLF